MQDSPERTSNQAEFASCSVPVSDYAWDDCDVSISADLDVTLG
jgi:hypothetical protein